jgi:hypothetical protein
LNVLEGYANATHNMVVKELIRGWDSFDREAYAKRILSHTWRNEKELSLERLPSLEGIQYFTNIARLTLLGCPQVVDLSPLAHLPQLSRLFLSLCPRVHDLSPIGNLTQMTELGLYNCSLVSDLSPLASLSQLLVLELYHCPRVTDLSPLAELVNLKKIYLIHPINLPLFIPQSLEGKIEFVVEPEPRHWI